MVRITEECLLCLIGKVYSMIVISHIKVSEPLADEE